MSELTNGQIREAHDALERLLKAAWRGSENEYEEMYHEQGRDLILKLLPPVPADTLIPIES